MGYLLGYALAMVSLVWGLSAYWVIMGLYVAGLFACDKLLAVRGGWRIPEWALLLGVFLGGAPFAMMAMLIAHHKTCKPLFVYSVALVTLWEIVIFVM